jgi:hypothetical protein
MLTTVFIRAVAVACAIAIVLAVTGAAGARSERAPFHVWVWETDSSIALSTTHARRGAIIFTVIDAGRRPHNFVIGGLVGSTLRSNRSTLLELTLKPGRYPYKSTADGRTAHGMKGVLTVD